MVMAVEASSFDERRDPFWDMRSVKSPTHAYAVAKCFLCDARYRFSQVLAQGLKNRDNRSWAAFFALDALVSAMKWRAYARTIRAAKR